MTTIVNTPPNGDNGNDGFGIAVAILVLAVVIGVLIIFGLPFLSEARQPVSPPKIEVPVDVKVNPSPAP
jgi:hypothetical protein